VIAASIVAGVVIGLYFPKLAQKCAFIGQVYLDLLKMLLMPFLLTTIPLSIMTLARSGNAARSMKRVLVVLGASLLLTAVIAVVTTWIFGPGRNLSESEKTTLGTIIAHSPQKLDIEYAVHESSAPVVNQIDVTSTLTGFIPENIFAALSLGDSIKVLVFTLLLSFGIAKAAGERGESLIYGLDTVYQGCQFVIAWTNLLLPVALVSMIANQVVHTGFAPILALSNFVLCVSVMALLWVCSLLVPAWVVTGVPPWRLISNLREPLAIAIATRNSIACIPSAINALVRHHKLDPTMTELAVPIGMTLCRYGVVAYFAAATIFMVELFRIPLTVEVFVVVVLLSPLAAAASAGSGGVLALSMIALVLKPLGLPIEVALGLLLAVDPLTSVLRTIMNVFGVCTVSAMVLARRPQATFNSQASLENP
jgi:Na+/H+-dicarboxylate symporter